VIVLSFLAPILCNDDIDSYSELCYNLRMEEKNYHQREWLIEHYVHQGLSCEECAKASGFPITGAAVHRHLVKHNIPTRHVAEHMKGERNPHLGKHHTLATCDKIRQSCKGRDCSPELRHKRSENAMGAKNHRFGKPRTHGRSVWVALQDGTILHMRSLYEVSFADWLCKQGKSWQYEPQTFILNDGSAYTPDFFSEGIYYEVKGWYSNEDKAKVERFHKTYPDLILEVIGKAHLKELGISVDRNADAYACLTISQALTRVCPTCTKTFIPGRKRTKFCSYACRKRPRKLVVRINCEVCGKPMELYPSAIRQGKKTCSRKCGNILGAQKRSGNQHWSAHSS
jgi:predicted nucleic acid-binding Zn ribbon protein